MQEVSQLTEFGKVLLFLIIGILFILIAFGINKIVSLNKPTTEKLMSYECGENPTGSSWLQFNSRFYVIALVFLLFDVEMAFIFPWATIFGRPELILADARWGWLTLIEMFIFVGVLLLGLVYVWKKGDLEWIRPEPILPSVDQIVPFSVYDNINNEVYKVRQFNIQSDKTSVELDKNITKSAARPAFKPVFKNSAQ